MKAISLFSGCGGFELGFDRAGIQTVLQAESDPWCLSVLARHWPDVERVTDVRSVGHRREPAGRNAANGVRPSAESGGRQAWTGLPGSVDLIYGGFPCQDVSVAGRRAGLGGERSGLWHEFERILRELRPRWCVGATSRSSFTGWMSSGMAWRGGYLTRATSESPNAVDVCSLSAVLESQFVPRKYWLSARAAAGILRRAEKRGKDLPPALRQALTALAAICPADTRKTT